MVSIGELSAKGADIGERSTQEVYTDVVESQGIWKDEHNNYGIFTEKLEAMKWHIGGQI